jgi:hypothetical protein
MNPCKSLFEGSVSGYWKSHYRFGKESVLAEKGIEKIFFIPSLLIRMPFLFAYGQMKQEDD